MVNKSMLGLKCVLRLFAVNIYLTSLSNVFFSWKLSSLMKPGDFDFVMLYLFNSIHKYMIKKSEFTVK